MSEKYKDDTLEYIESDIKKIQMKSSMYISYTGVKGATHLAKEAIQNAIDECDNKNSPAKNILITIDLLEDSLTVEDDGRGIPEDNFPLDIVCTKLQSGSKFTREQSGKSAGENGVGLTAINALSEKFVLSSIRNGESHTIIFNEGDKIDDTHKKVKKEHGTIIKFIPSKKYLGKSTKISKKSIVEWIDGISYFIPSKCKITVDIVKGLEKVETLKFKNRPFVELLKSRISNDGSLIQPITFSVSQNMNEEIRDTSGKAKTVKRDLEIQFAFGYTDALEPYIDSYCNYINTVSGGVHLEAVRESIWRFFMKKTIDSLSDKEKEKYKILKVDVEQGLNLIVNLFTSYQMQLVGQTKNAVGNDDLYDPIKKMATDTLVKYFNENKEKLTHYTKMIKTNCKARLEAAKARQTVIKDSKDKFDKFKYDKFTSCNNNGPKEYAEIHLCEGDSAANSLIDGRDPDTQAFFALRGVVANSLKRDVNTILDNAEWNTYIRLLGIGWGNKKDISKCRYKKIIIETDADVDGFQISSGIALFHIIYLPELVEAGMVYKSYPPLYKIKDSKHPYTRDRKELVELYQNKIISNYEIIIVKNGNKTPLTTKEFKEFIYDTDNYPTELVRISEFFGKGMSKFLVERIAAWLVMNYYNPAAPSNHPMEDMEELFLDNDFRIKFTEMLQQRFPEMTLKNKYSVRGIIDGKFKSININHRFVRKVSDLFPIYLKYGYNVLVKDKKASGSHYRQMSIGEFLDMTAVLKAKVARRFKGLGELNSQELWDTTLNPEKRILVQLTMDDYKKTLDTFEKLHKQDETRLAQRKKMMSEYKISREDLDN